MNILQVFIHYPISSGTYLKRALIRLGHNARSLGPCTGASIWGMAVSPQYVQRPEVEFEQREGWFPTTKAIEAFDGWQPDLIITCDSAYTMIGDSQCPHVVFGVDNHVRDYWPEATFDALFLAHSWGARMGEPNAHWLPPGYDPLAHTDLGIERPLDLALVGYPYAERIELQRAFAASGLRCLFGLGPVWDQYNLAYNQAKIALVRSVRGDLPMRFLENMSQGCCVLSDRTRDAEKLGFVAGVDYWPYDDPANAVREAKFLLDSGRWRVIADNGKRKVAPHTWDNRALELLDKTFNREEREEEQKSAKVIV